MRRLCDTALQPVQAAVFLDRLFLCCHIHLIGKGIYISKSKAFCVYVCVFFSFPVCLLQIRNHESKTNTKRLPEANHRQTSRREAKFRSWLQRYLCSVSRVQIVLHNSHVSPTREKWKDKWTPISCFIRPWHFPCFGIRSSGEPGWIHEHSAWTNWRIREWTIEEQIWRCLHQRK